MILLVMIILHSTTGVEIDVNEKLITNMRSPEPGHLNFTKDANCMINMSDGKFVPVRETCEEVRKLLGRDK